VLEKSDGLTDELSIELIAEIGDRRMADSLNQESAPKFRNGFGKEHHEEGDGDNGPDIVKDGGKN